MSTFLAMGGYGWFVWGSLGLCALVAVFESLLIRSRYQQAWQRAEQEAQARQHDLNERAQP